MRFRLLPILAALAAPALAADPVLLTGKRLIVQGRGGGAVQLLSSDTAIGPGRLNGSPDDPVDHGGSVRLVSFRGDVFDTTFELPARGWRYVGRKGANQGYRFRLASGPVPALLVKPGKLLRVVARSRDVGRSLGTDPNPVEAVLRLGEQQYCLSFGGTAAFKHGKRFVAKDAAAPVVCPLAYADDALWLCRPGMAQNQCLVNALDATAVRPNGSTAVEPHTGSEDHPYDCFYVYPTVDLGPGPANHTDFSDVSLMLDPLLSQAALLNGSCRIFASLYRQITLATFGTPDAAHYVDIAYGDVEDAFRRYLAKDNGGRNFVIMGHSQGTGMTTRLIQTLVDGDPALRSRLITALLIGGSVTVPEGQAVGGSFQNIPLCTTDAQTGCVIAYRSYAEGYPPAGGSNVQAPDLDTACTNPAALGGGEGRFAKTYFPNVLRQPLFQIVPDPGFGTAFSLYEDFYTGACVKDDRGKSYLEIHGRPTAGDVRTNPIPFNHVVLTPVFLGTHILDYSWAMGDLVRLVETKAAAMP